MNVSITEIFGRAFRLVQSNRVFWVLGLLLALVSAPIAFSGGTTSYGSGGADSAAIGTLGLLTCFSYLIFILLFVFVRPIIEGGLITSAIRAEGGSTPNLREAWEAGKVPMWRVLGLNLLLVGVAFIFAIVFVILFACVGGVLLASVMGSALGTSGSTSSTDFSAVLGFLAIIGVGLLIFLPVIILLSSTVELAKRAVVLDGYMVGQAWSRGWELARAHMGKLVLLVVGQFLLGLVLAIPIFIISFALGVYDFSSTRSVSVGASILTGLLTWVLTVLLTSLLSGWGSVVWTQFYRAVAPAPVAGVGGYGQQVYGQGSNYPYYGGQQPGAYGQPQDYGQQQPGGYSVPGQYPEYGRYGGPEQPTSGETPQPGGYSTPGQYPGGFRIPDGPTSETRDLNEPKPETDKPEA